VDQMQAKKVTLFLTAILCFSVLVFNVSASSNSTVSFRSGGLTIELEFPDEAHPWEIITHNVTITAYTNLNSLKIDLFIYAPINSFLQLIKNQQISWSELIENQSLPMNKITFQLPQQANGTLYCFMNVSTSLSTDYSAYSFYTTRVSNLTSTEMQSLYNEMLTNYTNLKAQYEISLNEYNSLLANYSNLFANYTKLLNENNELLDKYNTQSAGYEALLNSNNKLSDEYNNLNSNYQAKATEYETLQMNYQTLNSSKNSLQITYNTLKTAYDSLNQTNTKLQDEARTLQEKTTSSENALNSERIVMLIFVATVAGLVILVIYMRQKNKEPYLVIRKETGSSKNRRKIHPESKNRTPLLMTR
jgi:FtsZ-binding cell division protein ZapB